ncbi:MAG: GNAT family N-acetyltransferase [Acidobacteriota bacterium]|nr:GNAT family N-acetyltransferase [Acidobacteriota bacterium]
MNLKIQTAKEDDVPQIIALIREFAEYENLLDFCEITEERLNTALFGETKIAEAIIVFSEEEAPVAYAIFYPNFASFRGQRGMYLEDIYIKQEFRGRGVGEMMLRHIARTAKERGFERIDFLVLEWNAPAVGFYEKLGATRDAEERHFRFVGESFARLASGGGGNGDE